MLLTEWNIDEAKEVWREEAFEEGREEGREEAARNALIEGVPVELISKITRLDIERVRELSYTIQA